MTSTPPAAIAVVRVENDLELWLTTLASLDSDETIDQVFAFGIDDDGAAGLGKVQAFAAAPLSACVDAAVQTGSETVVLLLHPLVLPPRVAKRAIDFIRQDNRISCVSFISNAADFLSFPQRNTPDMHALIGHDQRTATEALQANSPDSGPVPLPIPAGSISVINRNALITAGKFKDEFVDGSSLPIADFALRAARRGFYPVADFGTYVRYAADLAPWPPRALNPDRVNVLAEENPSLRRLLNKTKTGNDSPLALGLNVARAKLMGLQVIIDASCLGPLETGTQVQAVAIIEALAAHPGIEWVGVATPNPTLPGYATQLLNNPKVRVRWAPDFDITEFGPADIVHRPYQPTAVPVPWDKWAKQATRSVVTLQDLIAYSIGEYHANGASWMAYRNSIERAARKCDAVVAISEDVAEMIRRNRIDVAPDRLAVIEQGTDHLSGNEATATPTYIAAQDLVATPFMLVLGTTYSHKNRDLAIKTLQVLKERDENIRLILAGISVGKGSTYREEALAMRTIRNRDDVVLLPDVTSEERNWLMKHAATMLYPTSAEGFGLVPFEAARFGTPTVHVGFGPLNEVLPATAATAQSWDPEHLADAVQRVLRDPDAREAAVSAVVAADQTLTWERTANEFVHLYRRILDLPKKSPPAPSAKSGRPAAKRAGVKAPAKASLAKKLKGALR